MLRMKNIMTSIKRFLKLASPHACDSDHLIHVILQDHNEPLTKIHFTAEGEVTFKCILYVPKSAPPDMFQNYGKIREKIKVCV